MSGYPSSANSYQEELAAVLCRESQSAEYITRAVQSEGLWDNKLLLVRLIKEGLSYSVFKYIRKNSPFTLQEWAGLLDISYKSLLRYSKSNTKLKPALSEKILELAEVFDAGYKVFGNEDKLRQWLTIENYALGNIKPIDLLGDSYGKELVLGELIRIDEGIFV